MKSLFARTRHNFNSMDSMGPNELDNNDKLFKVGSTNNNSEVEVIINPSQYFDKMRRSTSVKNIKRKELLPYEDS